jgi:5-methylcytosine-specific restriction endonuclease McrA
MLNQLISLGKDILQGKPAHLRSSKWPEVRKKWLETNNSCAACGCKNNLQIHHCIPFHLDRSKELDPTNFITLCEGKGGREDHLMIGHLGNWKSINPDVRFQAAANLAKINNLNNKV